METVTAEEGAEVRQRSLIGVAVRGRTDRRRPFGCGGPLLGLRRLPDERVDQSAVYGDVRVAIDEVVGGEPLHPPQYRVQAAAGPRRVGKLQHQSNDPIDVTRLLGVDDRRL